MKISQFFYHIKKKSMFENKIIAIAGGGDSAVDWALELLPTAKKFFLFIEEKN